MRLTAHIITSLLIAAAIVTQACGGLIGGNVTVNPSGRFPDVAYGNGKYLVVWPEYTTSPSQARGRFVTSDGAVSGSAFIISDTIYTSLYPSVGYNQTADEFIVTWDDEGRPDGDGIFGRRVSGATGLPIGASFRVSNIGVRSNPAWSSANNTYLVVYHRAWEVYGRRVDAGGGLLGSEIAISHDAFVSLYAAVAYGTSGNQFLVTWDVEEQNNVGDIRGQRIDAATGNLLGGYIPVTTNHHKNRSNIAYNPGNARWLVQFNDASIPGNSYDQTGQFVNVDGTLNGEQIVIAGTTAFEGDTLFGGDVAFLPGLGRYFSVFEYGNAMGGQELNAAGTMVTGTLTLSSGPNESLTMADAVDPQRNRFLVAWESFDGSLRSIRTQLYEAADLSPPGLVSAFAATAGSKSITLTWHNPSDTDFAGTLIRSKLGSFPANRNDGNLVIDIVNSPNSNDSFVHRGLTAGVVHYYAAFAYDTNNNYAAAATTTGIPAVAGDFEADGDVDQLNFGHLQACFSGDAISPPPGCADADLDNDGDVDGNDFTEFLNCLGGADLPPGC